MSFFLPFSTSTRASTNATATTSIQTSRKTLSLLPVAALSLLLLGGCAGDPADPAVETSAPAPASAEAGSGTAQESATATESPLSVREPWIKAADTGMTGAFGVLTNTGTEDVHVVGASSPAASSVELHETVAGPDGVFAMAETADGFTIPAGGEYVLEPGANHLMLMGLTAPVLPGDQIDFSLELADGSTVDFTATAKDFSGANESYHGK
ncbi:copper(I)-binding protein [Arthrobacter sp. UYP6]|uniref:copper chaperone PCu(A)C n=1 Tax=Arthrobacter sp. UYP6 TaxID=1756378 RepID=UPI00339AFFA6